MFIGKVMACFANKVSLLPRFISTVYYFDRYVFLRNIWKNLYCGHQFYHHFKNVAKVSQFLNCYKCQTKIGLLPVTFSFSLPFINNNPTASVDTVPSYLHRDIIKLINQGKSSLSKGDHYGKAEMFYLRALHLAIEGDDPVAVAYVQDLLANLALEHQELEKAEPLFRHVLKNLIATGKPQSDPAIIEVSLKLASIYARLGKKELAITGYQWSADTCRKNIQEMKKKKVPSSSKDFINARALLGMILDSYGRYLHDIMDNKTALKVTKEALAISQEIYGEKDIRTLIIYNELASIASDTSDYESALKYIQNAAEMWEAEPKLASCAEKAIFYANMAYIYTKLGREKEGKEVFNRALVEASKSNDKSLKSSMAAFSRGFFKEEKK